MLVALASAYACPTVVNGTPAALDFDVAQVVVVREGNRTTFSVSINPLGEGQGFALVMPVPEVLDESEVRTLDGSVFARLAGFTAPRRVTDAGCAHTTSDESDADTDSDSDADSDADGGEAEVAVEAEYLVGDYAITILSAEESGALGSWLDTHGYYMAPGAEPILAEYIEAGSFFMAAKVADGAALADGTSLPPLQIAYDSPMFAIPIRLAALNSPGEQDMVIYTITEAGNGPVAISNYPSFEIPETCRWGDPTVEDFSTFYEGLYAREWAKTGGAAWAMEFAGTRYDCSPCSDVRAPRGTELEDLGFTGPYSSAYYTRLHMRYTPEDAYQDLSLYTAGRSPALTLSYADDTDWNDCIDTCDPPDKDEDRHHSAACGCDAGSSPLGLGVLALLGLRRRR